MIKKNIFFLIFFVGFTLSSCKFKKEIKTYAFQKEKIPEENKILKVPEEIELKDLDEKLNIPIKTFKQNKLKELKINNNKKFKRSKNLRNKLYLNFALGYSRLKNYDVYNTSTNEAIWDDRYTKLGGSFEIGLGYDFGKVRTEITYAQENEDLMNTLHISTIALQKIR